MKKRHLISFLFLFCIAFANAQKNTPKEIEALKYKLDSLEKHIPALSQKVNFNIADSEFPKFIEAVAMAHKLNLSVDPNLRDIRVSQFFSGVTVKEVLIFSAEKFNLEISTIGSIIIITRKKAPRPKPRDILMTYNLGNDVFTIDLQKDSLAIVFKKITDITGKNLVFAPDLGKKLLSVYIKDMPFNSALDKLALSNNLLITKTKDNYYLFEERAAPTSSRNKSQRTLRYQNANFYFAVKDTVNKIIDVDFENITIANVIKEIGMDLNINMFTAFSLTDMKTTSFKASNIHFDDLLNAIFEKDTTYSFKKENGIYFFGKREQTALRSTVTIPLIHRTIQIMDESTNQNNTSSNNNSYSPQGRNNFNNGSQNQYARQQQGNISATQKPGQSKTETQDLLDIIPDDVKDQLQITNDIEQNSFIVSGPTQQIEKFRSFIKLIDKSVPVVLIEVMILEVSKNASVTTGVSFGLGDAPTKTSGGIYPNTSLNLGATSINNILDRFKGFGSINLGKVSPNFFAKIEAMEANGDIEIKSTPRLTTLNGHEATFSNGERSYYAVTTTDIIGTQNPQTREVKNYVPIDADLSLKIKPLVSGDGQITMSIKVIQSSFNGKKIDPDAPPGINSREFTSSIRVKDKDVIILGGLEENLKNDSGSGVPFLARIPIIKYLFSKRTRTASKMKLSVLIKPIIYK